MGKIEDNTTLQITRYYTNSVNQNFFRIIKLILVDFKNILFKYLSSHKFTRSTHSTAFLYNKVWKKKKNKEWFSTQNNIILHNHGKKIFLASSALTQRIWQQEIIHKINENKLKNILEIGSGNGISLKIFSHNFSKINFTGIDNSVEGINSSNELKNSILEKYMFYPLDINCEYSKKNLTFIHADAQKLSFNDKSFDCIFTILALEQMNPIIKNILTEIKRCATKHIFLIEPFKDLNMSGLKYLHHRASQYLSLNSTDFADDNFKLINFKKNYPNKLSLGVGLLHLERIVN
jgi:ubiquinone/menaquinone biosynthesis C-methylase UbiE